MTKKEIVILQDFKAFLEFALDNSKDYSFTSVLGTLGHDIRGIFDEDKFFLPRTNGYAKQAKTKNE